MTRRYTAAVAYAGCLPMAALRVVFILASNYSGSHLLSGLLDAHPALRAVGELRNVPRFLARPGPNRSGTVADYGSNPLFSGLLDIPVARWHRTLLERSAPPVTTLIDNSKRLDWLLAAMAGDSLELGCIHLLRDPRALIRRNRRTFPSDRERRRIRWREARRLLRPGLLIAPDAELLAMRWLRENREITAFIDRHELPAVAVSYEELVADPAEVIGRLTAFCVPGCEPHAISPAAQRSAGTRKPAWDGKAAPDALEADLRWRDDITLADQERVLGLGPVRAFVAEMGYMLTDAGLLPGRGHS